jgi:hypothetical protein
MLLLVGLKSPSLFSSRWKILLLQFTLFTQKNVKFFLLMKCTNDASVMEFISQNGLWSCRGS